ncbi:MAG: GTP-binding protein [Alphaproteobacteria bacterium]|nr:GTP-binding protein [Alphaproteobacteria bacterium]
MTEQAQPPSAADRLPVSVLTGFLGSGKTTLLSKLLRHPGMARTAVIINEFGEIGLDDALVEKAEDDTVLLSSGCLCCTIRNDLSEAMRNLYLKRVKGEVPEFQRVVIETTGLADPAPILHTLMADPLIAARFRLDSVVTTVDAVHGMGQLDKQFESVKQAAVADRIVLTKTDIAKDPDVAALQDRLKTINPGAPVMPTVLGEIDPDRLFDAGLYDPKKKSADVMRWLNEEAYHSTPVDHDHDHDHDHEHHGHEHEHEHGHRHGQHAHDKNRHDDHIRAFCLTFDKPLKWGALAQALDLLVQFHGDKLLRVKGLLNLVETDKPVVIHGVQTLFHPPGALPAWPNDDRRSRLVFITRDMEEEDVRGILRSFLSFSDVPQPEAAAATKE